MERFRSRSSSDGQGARARPRWAFAAPGQGARQPGPAPGAWPRLASRLLLLVALAAASLALTHCRMVGDRLAGVRVDPFNHTRDCVRACNATSMARTEEENDRHRSAVSACTGDPACLTSEATRHAEAMKAISAAHAACLRECHHQGGGTVGP